MLHVRMKMWFAKRDSVFSAPVLQDCMARYRHQIHRRSQPETCVMHQRHSGQNTLLSDKPEQVAGRSHEEESVRPCTSERTPPGQCLPGVFPEKTWIATEYF